MNKVIIKNGNMERTYLVPYGMIQASSKLASMSLQRTPYVLSDVSTEVFEVFRSIFSDYYNNAADSDVDIKILVSGMITNYPKFIIDLMNFVTCYDFIEIQQHLKCAIHNIVNNSTTSEIVKIFELDHNF